MYLHQVLTALVDAVSYVIALSRRHYDEIGFIPAPRVGEYAERGRLWIERENDELCGFLIWGGCWPLLRIYQICIAYDTQRLRHATNLIGRLIRLAETEGYERITCWVADDIPANAFWQAVGFVKMGQRTGGHRRGRRHNRWVYTCARPLQLALIQSPGTEHTIPLTNDWTAHRAHELRAFEQVSLPISS